VDRANRNASEIEVLYRQHGAALLLLETSLKFIQIPLLSELLALPRNISILYQNTILPRLESGAPTISIGLSPKMQQFVGGGKGKSGTERADHFRRAREVGEYFREHFETHHEEEEIFTDLGESWGRVPTTFGALGEEATARLLWHGYLSALAVSYSAFGIKPPDDICQRTIYHFRRLVSDTRPLYGRKLGLRAGRF
jgi:hypothetical protein